ncbi:MAG TPA: cytochrome P450, partial [Solirubrobacteraceae bacterium]|nr:cytochrome P450 [Solirubrobacteraceae bacterium]
MTSIDSDLEHTLVIDRETWTEGPPHALFRRLRKECPVHWSSEIPEFPLESGYWSLTTADDIHTV